MANLTRETILEMAKKLEGTEYNNVTIDKVDLITVNKSDGEKEGLQIFLSNKIAPVIYLESIVDELELHRLIEKAIDEIPEEVKGDILELLMDRSRYRLKAVNLQNAIANKYLNDKAYLKILDIAFIPTIIISSGKTIKLSEAALKEMGISLSEFVKEAVKNTHINVKRMSEVIMSLCPMDLSSDEDDPFMQGLDIPEDPGMYVAISPDECGVSILANNDLLQKTRDEIGNFYILPSSIHEVILLKDSEDISVDELHSMVSDINQAVVSEEDRLSNNVYYFDGTLKMADQNACEVA